MDDLEMSFSLNTAVDMMAHTLVLIVVIINVNDHTLFLQTLTVDGGYF